MKINLNDNVWVRLTPAGEDMWAKSWEDYSPSGVPLAVREAATERDGWIRFQLWDLMHTFGPALVVGCPKLPFEDNKIKLEETPYE